MSGKTTSEAMTNLAAALALIAIAKDDHERRAVTMTFTAQRNASGVMIENVSLGWKATKQ